MRRSVPYVGSHVPSPHKKRNRKKSRTIANAPHIESRKTRLNQRLHDLLASRLPVSSHPSVEAEHGEDGETGWEDIEEVENMAVDTFHGPESQTDTVPAPMVVDGSALAEQGAPSSGGGTTSPAMNTTEDLTNKWKDLLPTLHDAYTKYLVRWVGRPLPRVADLNLASSCCSCVQRTKKILCYFQDYFQELEVSFCQCETLPQVLVTNGLFPSAPSQPHMAFSIGFLDFYRALFARSCDAITALAAALVMYYECRGYRLVNSKGMRYQDPIRRGLSQAVQWYDSLVIQLEKLVDSALASAASYVQEHQYSINIPSTAPPLNNTNAPATNARPLVAEEEDDDGLTSGQCHRILQELCPCCFGGTRWGRKFTEGGDIHVATDGNLHHRHFASAGPGDKSYDPQRILPKEFVDAVGKKIEEARSRPAKKRTPKVPDEAVDECEKSHSVTRTADKAEDVKFDDKGLMVLVCRHGVPLFFANIDTPGEQQKYCIALIEHLNTMIPSAATLSVLYDIGCVVERSVSMFDILSNSIVTQLQFMLTAMHAYGHQWACQLVHNPRLQDGLGLTDGECAERIWSALRKLIALERHSTRSRRLWLVDCFAMSVAGDRRDDLGSWIKRKDNAVYKQLIAAKQDLSTCPVSQKELREEWSKQKKEQTSSKANTPSRLKKELEKVLALHSDIEALEQRIQTTKSVLKFISEPKLALRYIHELETTQATMRDQAEHLYSTLNIGVNFPQLTGVPMVFLQTLLLAREVKLKIRRRALGVFFEMDRLDRAVGGKQAPLGTKLHQLTRKAITKRKPVLVNLIKKFNQYCETLQLLHSDRTKHIPIPRPLPMELADLRNNSDLMEDVWISSTSEPPPRWLVDSSVRKGIQSFLQLDRALEEEHRLRRESENLCQWFGNKLITIEVALRCHKYTNLTVIFEQRRLHLLQLKSEWSNRFVGESRFDSHISLAPLRATILTQNPASVVKTYLPAIVPTLDEALGLSDQQARDVADTSSFEDLTVIEETINADYDCIIDVIEMDGNETDLEEDQDCPAIKPRPRELAPTLESISTLQSKLFEGFPGLRNKEDPTLQWSIPNDLRIDFKLLQVINSYVFQPPPGTLNQTRTFHDSENQRFVLEASSIQRLHHPTDWLNDDCINTCSALLSQHFCNPKCAILSSFLFETVQGPENDDKIWRLSKRTNYWSKSVWILPIHRQDEKHWVLCSIDLNEGRILLFDSFANERRWCRDVPYIIKVIATLVNNANRQHHSLSVPMDSWMVVPSQVEKVQQNMHDCGVWILTQVASILRGFHVSGGIRDHDMCGMRKFFFDLVMNIAPSEI